MATKSFGHSFIAILFGLVAANLALGQVWVGPGGGVRVRAPFVRVDVYPYDGGVSVRAPFAAVDVPGRYYGPPPEMYERRIVEPAFPTAEQLAVMDDEQLRQMLLTIAEQFQARLSRFNTGDTWQRYFRLTPEALGESTSNRDEQSNALLKLLERFQSIRSQPQFDMISSLPAFAAMEAAVNEAVVRLDAATAEGAAPRHEELPIPPPSRN